MTFLYDFIITNYIWILITVIVILLAIIGSYADKTNFGEGKKTELEEDKKKIDLTNKKLSDFVPGSKKGEKEVAPENKNINEDINVSNASPVQNTIEKVDTKVESGFEGQTVEEKLANMDKEISEILPQKDEFDSSILDELEDLSFDTETDLKFKKNNSFSLDDLELPKIKSLKEDTEDVWNLKY